MAMGNLFMNLLVIAFIYDDNTYHLRIFKYFGYQIDRMLDFIVYSVILK